MVAMDDKTSRTATPTITTTAVSIAVIDDENQVPSVETGLYDERLRSDTKNFFRKMLYN
jgi:hypothetical protein